MKFNLFIVFVLLIGLIAKAQQFSNGLVFSGIGTQQVIQTSVDKKGNQYLTIIYDSSFTADSMGIPIIIPQINGKKSYAIIKLDSTGRYMYNLRFGPHRGIFRYAQSINFDANNDVYFFFYSVLGDTIDVFDATKSTSLLFNKLKTGISSLSWNSYTLCKITQNGQLSWVNTMTYPDSLQPLLTGKLNYTTSCQTNVNSLNEITVHVLHVLPINNMADTLHITHSNGLETTMLVTDEDVLIKFSATGNLIYGVEPFKNRLKIQTDPITNRIYKSVTDGHYTYSINRFYLSTVDTFICSTPVPMNIGQNFLLIKSDERDSIIWAKWIGMGDAYNFVLDYNKYTHEIALGFTCLPYDFVSPYNPYYFSSNLYDIMILKLDTAGDVKWNKMYVGNDVDVLAALTYNQITNQLIIIGNTRSSDLQLDTFRITKKASPTHFIALMDTINNISSVQSIQSQSFSLGTNVILGIPITDQRGHTFIPGWFSDSIVLPCKTLRSPTGTIDGVLLTFNTFIPKDTGVCKRMISPSGKYSWDSAGIYYDTIPNSLGCDSVLLLKVNILQSKSVIDTVVCNKMISYSTKYTWDSTGIYYDTIPNYKGCDSIIKANVTIAQSRNTISRVSCKGIKSPSSKYMYDSSGTYFDTLPNHRGCDSIIRINLIINSSRSLIDTSQCGTYISPSGKLLITTTGTYTDTIPNSKNCDSIITIRYTKIALVDTIAINSCNAYTSPSGKYVYTLSGVYQDTIVSPQNCDSIIVINYKKLSTQSTLNKTVCDTFLAPSGKYVYYSSGTYIDTIPTTLGCDSIISINLIVKPIQLIISKSNDISCDTLFTILKASDGYTYLWTPSYALNNAAIVNPIATPTENTIYRVSVTDNLGCSASDSIEVLVNKEETIKDLANVFTPNDDGKNDCLSLKSIGEFKHVEFNIFNRWGARVFSTMDPNDCWDGKENHQELPSGTYFFIVNGISTCDTKIEQHGTIQLIR